MNRKGRDLAKDPPRVEHMILANDVRKLYGERAGFSQYDNNTDGFTPDDTEAEPAAAAVENDALITEG